MAITGNLNQREKKGLRVGTKPEVVQQIHANGCIDYVKIFFKSLEMSKTSAFVQLLDHSDLSQNGLIKSQK